MDERLFDPVTYALLKNAVSVAQKETEDKMSHKAGDTIAWDGMYTCQLAAYAASADKLRVFVPLAKPVTATTAQITRLRGGYKTSGVNNVPIDTESESETATFSDIQILPNGIGFIINKTGAFSNGSTGCFQAQWCTITLS